MNLHTLALTGAMLATTVFTLSSRGAGESSPAPFRWSTSVTFDETFDSSVYLQPTTSLSDRSSWVSSMGAAFELATQSNKERTATLSYAPTWTVFHSARAEDFVAHRFSASTQLPLSSGKVTAQASAGIIDGSDESPVWAGVGGAPAVGAPSVRDRRDQAVYRASVRSEWTSGRLLIRPVGTFYWGDFQTTHRLTAGCQNFVDRGDLAVGTDLLTSIAPKLSVGFGLRYGAQEQARLLAYPEEYDNRYVRLLALLEGPLARWCSVSLTIGPEFRHYGDRVHATFADRSLTNLFVDATVTFNVTRTDSIAFVARQFQQMSSSGRGAFDDRNLDLAWRRTFLKHVSGALVLHAYNTEFLRPAVRDDWVYTARLQCGLTLAEGWTLDTSVLLEEGASDIPDMPGREYTRQAFSLGLRTRF